MHAFNVFDFLKETVDKVPDLGGSEAEDRSATKRRLDERSINPLLLFYVLVSVSVSVS